MRLVKGFLGVQALAVLLGSAPRSGRGDRRFKSCHSAWAGRTVHTLQRTPHGFKIARKKVLLINKDQEDALASISDLSDADVNMRSLLIH